MIMSVYFWCLQSVTSPLSRCTGSTERYAAARAPCARVSASILLSLYVIICIHCVCSGWLVGSLSLLLLSVMNALSSVALARVAVRENVSKYDEAILSLLGPLPFRVYQFLMIFSTLGSLATAIVLIGFVQ